MVHKENPHKKYVVCLSVDERAFLDQFLRKGRRSAELVTRARILLKADVSEAGDGWSDSRSSRRWTRASPTSCGPGSGSSRRASRPACHGATTRFRPSEDLRRRGRGAAHRPGLLGAARGPCKVDAAPAGREGRRTQHRRTRQRQHDRADSKKNNLKPHLKRQWVIPPDANADFVAAWRMCWRSTRVHTTRNGPSSASTRRRSN